MAARRRSAGSPAATAGDVAATTALREAVQRAADAVIDGRTIEPRDRELVNRWAVEPPPAPVLGPDGSRRAVTPVGAEVPSALSAVARVAVDLLSAHDGRLRRCAGPRCSLLFHDASRPGRRRWCATSRCGNKVNTKAYRGRGGTGGSAPTT